MTLQAGDYADRQKAALVDENFFRFFPFPLESGTPETVLKEKIQSSCREPLPIRSSVKGKILLAN